MKMRSVQGAFISIASVRHFQLCRRMTGTVPVAAGTRADLSKRWPLSRIITVLAYVIYTAVGTLSHYEFSMKVCVLLPMSLLICGTVICGNKSDAIVADHLSV